MQGIKKLPGPAVKGSITVEAAIVFPFFILALTAMFLLIKYTGITISVNHTVSQAAKHIAASSYPVALINDFEDEVVAELPGIIEGLYTKISGNEGAGWKDDGKGLITELFTKLGGGSEETKNREGLEDGDEGMLAAAFDMLSRSVRNSVSSVIEQKAVEELAGQYIAVKRAMKSSAADNLLERLASQPGIDKSKLKVMLVSMPQSKTERNALGSNNEYVELCKKLGFTPGEDDAVVWVEYAFSVPVPFFNQKTLNARFVAVEKAWINGGYALYRHNGHDPDGAEPDDGRQPGDKYKSNDKKEIVYVTRTGIRYHKKGCRYLSKSCVPVEKMQAQSKKYTPCKVCLGR